MCVVAHKCLHHRNVTTGLNSDDLPNKHKMHSDAKSRVRSVQTRVDFRAMVLFIDQYGPYIYTPPTCYWRMSYEVTWLREQNKCECLHVAVVTKLSLLYYYYLYYFIVEQLMHMKCSKLFIDPSFTADQGADLGTKYFQNFTFKAK